MPRFLVLAIALVFFTRGLEAQLTLPQIPSTSRQPVWEPARTLVFLVGTLNWQNAKEYSSFPTKNRRDAALADFFRKAGVPSGRLVYLQDKAATLAAIRSSLSALLKTSAPNDTLIVYYCGHGYSSDEDDNDFYFASYDAAVGKIVGWSVTEMVAQIEAEFKGKRVMLMADCCQSGGMVMAAKKKGNRHSYAVYAASESDQSSTGNWTFTESLLAAWRGEGPVDADRNGVVTLEEMKRYVRSEMEFAEEQKSKTALTGEWQEGDVLAPARKLVHPREGEHVEVFAENDWWTARIVDGKDDKFKVFYYGYEADEAEWVGPKRMRAVKE